MNVDEETAEVSFEERSDARQGCDRQVSPWRSQECSVKCSIRSTSVLENSHAFKVSFRFALSTADDATVAICESKQHRC